MLGTIFFLIVVYIISSLIFFRSGHFVLKKYIEKEIDFERASKEFDELFEDDKYVSNRMYLQWKEKNKELGEYADSIIEIKYSKYKDIFKQSTLSFLDQWFWYSGRAIIDYFNNDFSKKEIPKIIELLDKKKIQCNNEQLEAIVSEEDNTLLIAGAGTGKTRTILGKIVYLIDGLKIDPKDILLLSFTTKTVKDLNIKIASLDLKDGMKARTFHSFGSQFIGLETGEKPNVAFDNENDKNKFIDEKVDLFLEDDKYREVMIDYFYYYSKPNEPERRFKDLNEYYTFVKQGNHVTILGKELKSKEEVNIANFLYMNGIEYSYEEPYKHETTSPERRQYKPDFYLPDYDLYIEHFGIDINGNVYFCDDYRQNEEKGREYNKKMEWARGLHKQHNTKLIETFSHQFSDNTWKSVLTKQLSEHNIKLNPRSSVEVLKKIRKTKAIKGITKLFSTFLNLAKSNNYSIDDIRSIIISRGINRESAFFDIYAPIHGAYEEHLHKNKAIDFDDMLNESTELIKKDKCKRNFKYVLIDEFQDFSKSKNDLVKAIVEKGLDTKVFCVGDDWQSIYRFAGSDVELFKNIENSFGFTNQKKLSRTYRFNNELAIISNKFICKNPEQILKEVISVKPPLISGRALDVRYPTRGSDKLLFNILNAINSKSINQITKPDKKIKVFLLGRYKHNEPENLSAYKTEFRKLDLEFSTVHSSKGLEADYVIILDVTCGTKGFPSEMEDDPLLEIVLENKDIFPHEEERRLMYVAMTRARHKVFLMSDKNKKSVFATELDNNKDYNNKCSKCSGEMVERKGDFVSFFGCINFPECKFKKNKKTEDY